MSGPPYTWDVPVTGGAVLWLVAGDDGLVTLGAGPEGPVRLDAGQRAALTVALDAAGRTATGLHARRATGGAG